MSCRERASGRRQLPDKRAWGQLQRASRWCRRPCSGKINAASESAGLILIRRPNIANQSPPRKCAFVLDAAGRGATLCAFSWKNAWKRIDATRSPIRQCGIGKSAESISLNGGGWSERCHSDVFSLVGYRSLFNHNRFCLSRRTVRSGRRQAQELRGDLCVSGTSC